MGAAGWAPSHSPRALMSDGRFSEIFDKCPRGFRFWPGWPEKATVAKSGHPEQLPAGLRNINKFHSEREPRQCIALPSYYLPLAAASACSGTCVLIYTAANCHDL